MYSDQEDVSVFYLLGLQAGSVVCISEESNREKGLMPPRDKGKALSFLISGPLNLSYWQDEHPVWCAWDWQLPAL